MPEKYQEQLKMYAIYDKKSKKYDQPFFAFNDIFAKRRYLIMQSEAKSPLAMWPEDFDLQRIGSVDMDSAELKNNNNVILTGV